MNTPQPHEVLTTSYHTYVPDLNMHVPRDTNVDNDDNNDDDSDNHDDDDGGDSQSDGS